MDQFGNIDNCFQIKRALDYSWVTSIIPMATASLELSKTECIGKHCIDFTATESCMTGW